MPLLVRLPAPHYPYITQEPWGFSQGFCFQTLRRERLGKSALSTSTGASDHDILGSLLSLRPAWPHGHLFAGMVMFLDGSEHSWSSGSLQWAPNGQLIQLPFPQPLSPVQSIPPGQLASTTIRI